MKTYEKLFEPIQIGNVTVKNRIAMEPMLLEVAELDGTAGDKLVAYYEERAKGGVGLIQTEVTRVSDWTGCTGPRQLSVTSDRCIPGLRRLADAVHKYDSKLFVQLHHTGRQTLQLVVTAWKLSDTIGRHWDGWWKVFFTMTKYLDFFDKPFMHNFYAPVVSASNVSTGLGSSPVSPQHTRPLTKWEIRKIEDEFAEGALRCKKAGVDGVMLHCSHGYLLQQFLSPYTNRRTDEYGGSLENRTRIVKEIMEKIQHLCGKDYPITVRLTVDEYYRMYGYDVGLRLDEGVQIAKLLEQYGAAAIDVSSGTYDTMNTWCEPTTFAPGWRKGNAAAVKKAVHIPVIAANLIRTPEQAEQQLEEGTQDMIGLGRPLLADPYFVKKAEEGRAEDITRCICCLWCLESMYNGALKDESGECALNPRTCYETKWPLVPEKTGNGRSVAVIGAGPAGLTAAKVLAQRGFHVVVFERNYQAGGQLLLASVPPLKKKILWAVEDLKHDCDQLGVTFRFGTEATAKLIGGISPCAIFDATGGCSVRPSKIPGSSLPNVCTADDILSGAVKLYDKEIAVIGSGMTGLETAETLVNSGNRVTVVEMADTVAPGTWHQHIDAVMPALTDADTTFLTSARLVEILPDAIEVERLDKKLMPGLRSRIPCDAVVLSLGVRKNGLPDDFSHLHIPIIPIGDADHTGRIANATHTAYKAAMELK